MDYIEKLNASYNALRRITDFEPDIGLVLGSGLGDYAEKIEIEKTIPYYDIEGFPMSTIPGHAGRFVLGRLGDAKIMIMQGRVHYNEGYDMKDVVLPMRVMGLAGMKVLVLTNASGSINASFNVGDLMLIRDHISSFVPSPLIGPNDEALGTRFPDMGDVYPEYLRAAAREAAAEAGFSLREGVYIQTTGPNFETPAEIRMYSLLGADVVGMSTTVEAIAARHMGIPVCGISCVSNMAAGISPVPLSHEDVKAAVDIAAPRFKALLDGLLPRIHKIIYGGPKEA